MNKIDFRTLSETERFAFRRQAIRLRKSGRSQKEIARIIGIRPATICQWCKDYDHEGQKGLIAKKRGVKSEDKKFLSDSQERLIQKMITDTMPDQLKLNFALWTRKAVKELAPAGVTNNHC